VKSLMYCLNFLIIFGLFSCQQEPNWFKREFSEEEKLAYAKELRNGVSYYYQGTVPEQYHIKEAIKLDTNDGDLWREFGTARVKRGLADEMQYYYGKAAAIEPDPWAGFRGYLYLYFYRDYPRAIADFNLTDSVTGTISYSQGQNHDYMRGIAYYGLKDYPQALRSLSLYIDSTIAKDGEEWVDAFAVLYRALSYEKLQDEMNMKVELLRALRIYSDMADAHYHLARLAYKSGDKAKAQELIRKAETNFKAGYYHNRPYVEVLEQIYLKDITELSYNINHNMLILKEDPPTMFPD
jgi:Tfp pilus assembly protein PilF